MRRKSRLTAAVLCCWQSTNITVLQRLLKLRFIYKSLSLLNTNASSESAKQEADKSEQVSQVRFGGSGGFGLDWPTRNWLEATTNFKDIHLPDIQPGYLPRISNWDSLPAFFTAVLSRCSLLAKPKACNLQAVSVTHRNQMKTILCDDSLRFDLNWHH